MVKELAVKALVTGAGGQLGRTVARVLAAEYDVVPLTRAELDLTDESRVRAGVAEVRPGVIVNCAAYNAVDDAEDDAVAALEVNAFGVRSLAQAAARIDATLVHYGTDFVFDGVRGTPMAGGTTPTPTPTPALPFFGAFALGAGVLAAGRARLRRRAAERRQLTTPLA